MDHDAFEGSLACQDENDGQIRQTYLEMPVAVATLDWSDPAQGSHEPPRPKRWQISPAGVWFRAKPDPTRIRASRLDLLLKPPSESMWRDIHGSDDGSHR